MDFDFSDEQRLLKDSVDRLIADQYQFEQRKKYQAAQDGWSREIWQQYAESATCSGCRLPKRMAASAVALSKR